VVVCGSSIWFLFLLHGRFLYCGNGQLVDCEHGALSLVLKRDMNEV
jgi:hypothetical protein